MFGELAEVLTCSNLTCLDPPVWYLLAQNWLAHIGMGVLLFAFAPRRLAWTLLALLILKEGAVDLPRDFRRAVLMDSLLDLACTILGAALGVRRRASNAPEKPLSSPAGAGVVNSLGDQD